MSYCGNIKKTLLLVGAIQLIAIFLTFIYYHGRFSNSEFLTAYFRDPRFLMYINMTALLFFPSLCIFIKIKNKLHMNYYLILLGHVTLLCLSAFGGTLLSAQISKYVFWYEFSNEEILWRVRDNSIIVIIIYIFYMVFYMFRMHYATKNKEIEMLNRLRAESKFAALQSKMNPHFLFNTLNTILELAKTDLKKLEMIVENLSEIYRYIINIHDNQLIELEVELNIIEKYLQIEKIRLGNRLQYRIDCPKEAKQIQVIPLMVETIVENAVIHGISQKNEGGEISIYVTIGNKLLRITIDDTGVGFDAETAHSGFGIRSVEERLLLLFGSAARCSISTQIGKGTRVVLEVPYAD